MISHSKTCKRSTCNLSSNSTEQILKASYPQAVSPIMKVISGIWLVFGLTGLILVAWLEPFSQMFAQWLENKGVSLLLIEYLLIPSTMILRAILLVESIGYAYHRFFQHVGVLTRCAQIFRKNQRYHWIHHMVIYPIGTVYKRARKYISAEKGVGWSWVLPGILATTLFLFTHGFSLASLVFVTTVGAYAKFVISCAHSRFHVVDHPWANRNYFHWLEDIHVLHHWDQRKNFTIVHPLMDVLFGTYLSPKNHQSELKLAYNEDGLTVSDLINWRYLLIEATPAERATFISHVKYHSKSKKKLSSIMEILQERTSAQPEDLLASLMFKRGKDVMNLVTG